MRKKIIAVAVVAAAAFMAPHASANTVDAVAQYAAVVQENTSSNLNEAAEANDNITCDPAPIVDGRMLAPRVPYAVGELYALVEIAGHLKCFSLDTGRTFTLYGTVTDMYYRAGAYQSGGSASASMRSVAGVATVNPATVISYPGGHGALNTWHYVAFVGTTSTGRIIRGASPLFYVAGV